MENSMEKEYIYSEDYIKLARKRFSPLFFILPVLMTLVLGIVYTLFDTVILYMYITVYSLGLIFMFILLTYFIRKFEKKHRNTKFILTESSLDRFVNDSKEQSILFTKFHNLMITNNEKGEFLYFTIHTTNNETVEYYALVELDDLLERIKDKFSESQITTRII